MVSGSILLCLAALFTICVSGKRLRTPCEISSSFRCDDGYCIAKHEWCDGRYTCGDHSDETYCNSWTRGTCNENLHFECDNGRCIPLEGYCDGYSSCPDKSDEKDCPCEELYEKEENIQFEAYINKYRTHQKCWKISVNEAEYIQLKIFVQFFNRGCNYGNLTVYSEEESLDSDNVMLRRPSLNHEDFYEDSNLLCPSEYERITRNKSFIFHKDVYIRYRSNFYDSSSNIYKDFLNITFQKIDVMCQQFDAFKCSKFSCISPEKQCDGIKDCENGLDERNCDYGALSAKYLVSSRIKATQWMRNQHNADWGWKENTHRAIVALHLAGGANFNGSSKDDDLIAKQLELEILTHLLRHKFDDKIASTELAAYINALLVICHDPRNFYGFNLITALKKDLEKDSSFTPPLPYLTLCNAEEPLSEDAIDRLMQILEISSPNHGFVVEIQALATMALSCINNNEDPIQFLEENITNSLNSLKKHQMEDGSFGNKYTTALVLQALIANNQENAKDWNPKSSIQFLSKRQEGDGSFGDFLTTYLIMPVLNAKSLLDIGKINCTDSLKRPRDGNTMLDIKSQFGKKVVMKYSLFIGNEKDQIHPLFLRAPENITVLELMTLAADIDPKYKFNIHEIRNNKYIYEISNIPNDPENNRFWFIYQESKNSTTPIPEQSPDKIKAHEKDHIVMWYKTLDSL